MFEVVIVDVPEVVELVFVHDVLGGQDVVEADPNLTSEQLEIDACLGDCLHAIWMSDPQRKKNI